MRRRSNVTGPIRASPEVAYCVVHKRGERVARTHIIPAMPMQEVAPTRDSRLSIRGTAIAAVRDGLGDDNIGSRERRRSPNVVLHALMVPSRGSCRPSLFEAATWC